MDVIEVGLCSYGMSGKVFHAPFLQVHPAFHLRGVFERSEKRVANDYPGTISYDTFDQMLEDGAIQLIVVNTPNASHYEYAKQALLAGKHVLVEKPFVVYTWQADELIQIAEEKSLVVSVYHNRRFDSDFRTVKKIVEEELVGTVVEAEFHFDRYKEALSPKLHKESPVPGAGILYDLGSHILDQSLYLFGKPQAVFADVVVQRAISQVDDYFELLLYYNDKRVRLKGGYQVREPLPSYVVHGSKGSFLKSRGDIQEAALIAGKKPLSDNWGIEPESEQGLLHTEVNGKVIRKTRATERGNYYDYFEQLSKAILQGAPVPVSATEGKLVIQIIEAAFESSRLRRVVDL